MPDLDRTIVRRVTNGHAWYTLDGYLMPSPSKIKLEAPFLQNWQAGIAAGVIADQWEHLAGLPMSKRQAEFQRLFVDGLNAPAESGRHRHQLMEALLKGEKAKSQDPAAIADAEAACRVIDAMRIQPIASEQAVVNTEIWCSGTTDVIADVPGYGRVVMDFKFTKEVWPDYALQLSAYNHMTNTIVEVEQFGPRGGKLKSTWDLGPMPEVRKDMALVLNVHEGVPRLVEVKTDGWVWLAVVAWVRAWWLADPKMRKTGPGFDSPISAPVDLPETTADDDKPPF